jgi:L-fuconolactonase
MEILRSPISWISENMGLLRRDFLIQDLRDILEESDIEGVVTVQARQALAETRWLLDLARSHDFIRGVVGWVALSVYPSSQPV